MAYHKSVTGEVRTNWGQNRGQMMCGICGYILAIGSLTAYMQFIHGIFHNTMCPRKDGGVGLYGLITQGYTVPGVSSGRVTGIFTRSSATVVSFLVET